jgi:hypothetical protein
MALGVEKLQKGKKVKTNKETFHLAAMRTVHLPYWLSEYVQYVCVSVFSTSVLLIEAGSLTSLNLFKTNTQNTQGASGKGEIEKIGAL